MNDRKLLHHMTLRVKFCHTVRTPGPPGALVRQKKAIVTVTLAIPIHSDGNGAVLDSGKVAFSDRNRSITNDNDLKKNDLLQRRRSRYASPPAYPRIHALFEVGSRGMFSVVRGTSFPSRRRTAATSMLNFSNLAAGRIAFSLETL
jgi:hypothetical protein